MKSDGTVMSSSTKKLRNGGNSGSGIPTLPSNGQFGGSIAALGDLDGDGVTDLAVGSIQQDGNGGRFIRVLLMNSDGTVNSSRPIGSGVGGGPTLASLGYFGKAIAFLGDLRGYPKSLVAWASSP